MIFTRRRHTNNRPLSWELIIPPKSDQTPVATKALFDALATSRWRLFKPTYRAQIRATKDTGSQFIWSLPAKQVETWRRLMGAYLVGLKLKPATKTGLAQTKYYQRLHFRPVEQPGQPTEAGYDPINYLTVAMAQLQAGEQINYRLNFRSKSRWLPSSLLATGAMNLVDNWSQQPADKSPPTTKSPMANHFKARLAIEIKTTSKTRLKDHRRAIKAALQLMPIKSGWRFSSGTVSAGRLAELYHLPNPATAVKDDLNYHLSPTLPLPVALKQADFMVDLGFNHHRQLTSRLGLTANQRQRHLYILGGTGTGKTNLVKNQAIADIKAGRGLAVIDPHGDLVTDLLYHIPPNRIDDVIYFNPVDYDHPIGINLLKLDQDLSGVDLIRHKELITEITVSILRKLFTDDIGVGHRIEYVLRNTIQTALTVKDCDLFTIFRLLNKASFRKQVVTKLKDPDLKSFWVEEIGRAGSFQKVKMVAGVTTKIGRFLFSVPARQACRADSRQLDFLDVINSNKILLGNFSKGLIGEDSSRLFGAIVLAKLQLAALERVKQTDRPPFYIYVDEFQNFASKSFVEMLSESRKYQLLLTMAQQSTQQQVNPQLTEIILANVGTVVAFRSASPQDGRLLANLFAPDLGVVDLVNLPAFRFYARLAGLEVYPPISGCTKLCSTKVNHDRLAEVVNASRKNYTTKLKPDLVLDKPD